MHNPTSRGAAAAASLRPGCRGRFATIAASFLLLAGVTLPSFAQKYVAQYNDAYGPVGEALDTVNGVTYLYVADESHGNVIKINVATGTAVATFGSGSQGNAAGQFGRPYGIAVDPTSHDLYVTERLNGRVQRINSTTGASVMMWGINDAAFNSAGTNTNSPNPTSPQGHFQEPVGVVADKSGNVFVVDHGNNRVQKFLVHQVNGAWTADNVTMWGTTGAGNGQFDHPYGATLDTAGNLWVADGLNGRVQKFDASGNYLGSVGSKGTGTGQFVIATWVNFDSAGALYVTSTNSDPQNNAAADINSQWVSKFSVSGNTGTFVSRFGGTYGTNPGEFRLPFDVVVDAASKAYVTDYYNSRVQVFDLTVAGGTTTGGSTSGGTSSGGTTTGGTTTGGTTTGGTTTGGTTTGGTTTGGTTTGGTTTGGTTTGGTTTGGTTTGGTSTGGTSSGGTSTGGSSTGSTSTGSGSSSSATSVVSVAGPSTGIYSAGDRLTFTVHFASPVVIAGTSGKSDDDDEEDGGAHATLNWSAIGGGDSGQAQYVGGSGTADWTFKYQVHGNDTAPNGIVVSSIDVAGTHVAIAAAQGTLANVVLLPANAVNHGGGEKNGSAGSDKDTRLINLSSRLKIKGGDASHAVAVGFVVSGSTPQSVLIRAVGPGLRAFGITDALSDPKLTIQNSSGKVVGTNSGWNNDGQVSSVTAKVGAFALLSGSHDAALVLTLPPGAYTATVDGTKGTALIEVYDAATAAAATNPQLVNISTRGFVETDDNLIAGFVVSGTAPKRVLVRAIGPGLDAFGVKGTLADPILEIHDANGAVVARNNDWQSPVAVDASHPAATAADIAAADTSTGAFPLNSGSKDAAVVLTLAPGSYSAVVTGANHGSGAVLVEVYEVATP